MANTTGSLFRKVTRAAIQRKYLVDGIQTLTPIAINEGLVRTVDIDPGVSVEKIKGSALTGAEVTVYTYDQAREAQLQITFGGASQDIEQMILGRISEADTNFNSWVYHEVEATATTRAALTGSQIGTAVAEQTATGALANGTYVYYINGITGIAIPVTVIDYSGTPASETEIAIGEDLALKFHADAVSNSRTYIIRVPGVYPSVQRISSVIMNEVEVTLWGTNLDGSGSRIIHAKNCSLNYGTSISSELERQISLEILPDPNDGTGLGFSITDVPLAIAA